MSNVTEAERVKVAAGLSLATGIPLSEEEGIGALTLGGYLRELCTRYGTHEAAVMRVGEIAERWTYDALWEHSVAVARALLACGIGKGARVGILMTNRLEFLSSLFGTALAGAVATPISTFSTSTELEILLRNSACSVLLFERHILKKDFAALLIELEPKISAASPDAFNSLKFPYLRHLAIVDNDAIGAIDSWKSFLARGNNIAREQVDATAATVSPADPGVLFFSSGSTGIPKGILSAHRGVCLQLWRWRKVLALDEGVRCWVANGFFWSGNFAMGIGGAFSAGGTLVLQKTFQPEEALTLMQAECVSYIFAWPHQWAQLTDARNWLDVDLSSLRYVDKNSPIAQHPSVHSDYSDPVHSYGNTETFTLSTALPANTLEAISAKSHGVPLAGNTFKIVDPLTGAILPLGEKGEIAVKGPTLMLGYIGIPLDETLDAEGFFRTGDAGFIDEVGRLYWQGRLNDIIKTGGANVSPLEIDAVLAQCPGVKITKTIGVPDALLGELVVACIVLKDGMQLSEQDIRDFVKARLASYKVPRKILFFAESEIDMTGSAKVKSAELRTLVMKRLA